MGVALEEGEGGELDAKGWGGGVGGAKRVGAGRVRRWFGIYAFAHRSL